MSQNRDMIPENEQKNKRNFSYAFKQQVMKAWQPVPTLNSTIALFLFLSVFFLAFGSVLLIFSNKIKEFSIQYNEKCYTTVESLFEPNLECILTLNIQGEMEAPIFVYYELENYYQNHRRYVKSREVNQLQGDNLSIDDIKNCEPITLNKHTGRVNASDGYTALDPEQAANPCGLIAKSLFNDTYEFDGFEIEDTGIAWPSDKENKFKRLNAPGQDWNTIQWTDVEDERFMVWMRTAALPYFRKLWGRVEVNIPDGELKITVQNHYDVSAFDGRKTLVLSTANEFGGKNNFLAVAYLVVGCICFVITIAFIVKKFKSNDRKKDVKKN